MKTNLEKWNYYLKIVNARSQAFIDETFKDDPAPKMLYEVAPIGKMNELTVTNVAYRFTPKHNISVYFYGKKPTREDVAQMALASEADIDFEVGDIIFSYEYEYLPGKIARSGITIKRLIESKSHFTDRSAAEAKVKEITHRIEKENELLANGYIRCAYCNKVVPGEEAVSYTVIARQYPNMRKQFLYCSKQCGVYDQMAHEG